MNIRKAIGLPILFILLTVSSVTVLVSLTAKLLSTSHSTSSSATRR